MIIKQKHCHPKRPRNLTLKQISTKLHQCWNLFQQPIDTQNRSLMIKAFKNKAFFKHPQIVHDR
jgi:hypothetical protein